MSCTNKQPLYFQGKVHQKNVRYMAEDLSGVCEAKYNGMFSCRYNAELFYHPAHAETTDLLTYAYNNGRVAGMQTFSFLPSVSLYQASHITNHLNAYRCYMADIFIQ